MSRVLFFSPYARWHYLAAIEILYAHALSLRGAEIRFLACDALLPECDVHWRAVAPRPADSCRRCQATATELYRDLQMPFEWLGGWAPRPLRARIRTWADSIPTSELVRATWAGYPVATWCHSSMVSQLRSSHPDLAAPGVERMFRDHLYGVALSIEATRSALDEWQPDVLFTLNGRFFPHWAAFELARERGIRVISWDRGLIRGSIRLLRDRRCHAIEPYEEIWRSWADVPLDAKELENVWQILQDRRTGKSVSHRAFSPPPQAPEQVRAALGLRAQSPLVAVFTSSDDESSYVPERRQGAFPDPRDFLPAVSNLAQRMPECDVVIRLHPNLDQTSAHREALLAAERIRAELPPNARLVAASSQVSSYTIADLADVGLVYFSTLGLEMAATGKPVVSVARGWFGTTDFVHPVHRPGDLDATVRAAMAHGFDPEIARRALRFAARMFDGYSQPFPFLVEDPPGFGRPTVRDTAELAPGRSALLDRLCAFVLDGTPLLSEPSLECKRRSTADEDSFLATRLGTR